MEDALNRILTPKRSVDILRDVETAKEQSRPYVIVFVGVNGVGKSTNLAKVGKRGPRHEMDSVTGWLPPTGVWSDQATSNAAWMHCMKDDAR